MVRRPVRPVTVATVMAAITVTVAAGCGGHCGDPAPRPAAAGVNFVFVRRDGTVNHIYLMLSLHTITPR
jgi:hypothetical protein